LKKEKFSFQIFFAGEGTYKLSLENKTQAKGYDTDVTFLGHVDHEEMPDIYNMADVMVLPSETEGAPMVILEALACGTPVIASNVGAVPDLVFDGINGRVLEDLSPEKISSAIMETLFLNIAREGIALSINKYSAVNFAKSFDKIISNVLNE
jgi:glycosyltransferase involved in cell wall biosynthesis